MGNTPSSNAQTKNTTKPNETPTYQLVQKVDDPHYGDIKLVRDTKTGEQIYLKEIIFSTREAFKAEVNAYNKRIAVSHPNIVRILGCTSEDKPNMCSGYFRISVFIEVLPKTLQDEVNRRLDTNVPFAETEILLVAESVVSALSYFETQNICHGDIRPANIFLTRHGYKLSDPYLNVNKTSNALSNAIVGEAETLLAPQLLANLPFQDFNVRCNKFKADVFSLGATLLTLATLQKSEDLYDYDYGTFDITRMRQRLEEVRQNYSKFTYDLIRSMLRIGEDTRPDFISLANKFLPFQEDIRRKVELPQSGLRAQYEDSSYDEDYLELQKLLPKVNPNNDRSSGQNPQQMSSRLSPIRDSQRSRGSQQQPQRVVQVGGGRPSDRSRPVENVYTVNLEEEEYQYGQEHEPMDFLGGYEEDTYGQSRFTQSPGRYQEQEVFYQESLPTKSKSPEQVKKSYQVPEPEFQHHIFPQRKPVSSVQQQQQQQQAYYPPEQNLQQEIYPARQSQVLAQSQSKPQVQAPSYTKTTSFPRQNSGNQVTIPIQNLTGFTNTKTSGSNLPPMDDLEAKIRAALQRSETTYQEASQNKTNPQLAQSGTSYQPNAGAGGYTSNYPAYNNYSYGGGGQQEGIKDLVTSTTINATPLSLHGSQARDYTAGNVGQDRNPNAYTGYQTQFSTNLDSYQTGYTPADRMDNNLARSNVVFQPGTSTEKITSPPNYGYNSNTSATAFGNYGNFEVYPNKTANDNNTYSYGSNQYQYNYQGDQGVSLGANRMY